MKTTDLRERIATRAYFAAMNDGYKHSPDFYWIYAEQYERVERRVAAARKGAATRAMQRAAIAGLPPVAGVAARKPAARRASVH